MEHLHILDGYGYIFRAFYGLAGSLGRQGVQLSTESGLPTGALYVYTRMLVRLYKDVRPERIAVVFDAPGKTFRDEIDADYKATRRETPEELKVQMPYFRPVTEAFCWPVLSVSGVEADDVIATLTAKARKRDWKVTIHSGDKDLMQLVDDNVTVVDSLRQITYDEPRVTEKFGVPPALVADWLSMVGDKSDNVPGMPGVGKVTASKLLNQYGSLDEVLANTDKMKGKQKERFEDPANIESVRMSQRLVALKRDVEVEYTLDDLVPSPWDGQRIGELFTELEFGVLLASLDGTASGETVGGREKVAVEAAEIPAPEIVLEPGAVDAVVAAAREHGRLGLHLETDGQRPDRCRTVGVAIAADGVAPAYIPFQHRYLSMPKQLEVLPAAVLELLADTDVEVVCHDSKAIRRGLHDFGAALAGAVFDTMLAAYLLDAKSALHETLKEFGDVVLPTRTSLLGKGKSAISYEAVSVEDGALYAGHAAAGALRAAEKLRKRLERDKMAALFDDVEVPLAATLADIESRGVMLDTAWLRELSVELDARVRELEKMAWDAAGEMFNLGSPKQLAEILFAKLKLEGGKMKKTKTGYSTDHEVLESLRDAHPVVPPILEHRELTKLKGTYVDALPPLVNPATGRLHTSFNQAVAATGRLSSQDPNLQNIPIRSELGRKIRRAFIAPEGKVLVSADYSQIELRILAHLSQDEVLCRAFRDRLDVHAQTAAEVFGIDIEDVDDGQRRIAKAVNYGLAYGQTDFGLSRAIDIPRSEAKHYIETYFNRFAGVRRYMEALVNRAAQYGYAITILGRRRPIPDIHARNYTRKQAAKRIAQNTPIQGAGADLLKLAMLAVQKDLDGGEFSAQMLLTVHDELVFECDRGQGDGLAARVKTIMESVYELSVPLQVDIGIGPTWAEAH